MGIMKIGLGRCVLMEPRAPQMTTARAVRAVTAELHAGQGIFVRILMTRVNPARLIHNAMPTSRPHRMDRMRVPLPVSARVPLMPAMYAQAETIVIQKSVAISIMTYIAIAHAVPPAIGARAADGRRPAWAAHRFVGTAPWKAMKNVMMEIRPITMSA